MLQENTVQYLSAKLPQCCQKLTVQSLFATLSKVLQETQSTISLCSIVRNVARISQYISSMGTLSAVLQETQSTLLYLSVNNVRCVARISQYSNSMALLSAVLQENHSTISLCQHCLHCCKILTVQFLDAKSV
jgi:hypothetical protein